MSGGKKEVRSKKFFLLTWLTPHLYYGAGGVSMLKISEFQTKDVVNIIDGKKLGTVCDLEIDLKHGRIDAIVCPGPGKFFGLFANGQDVVIPWNHIVKIGSDVILVRLDDRQYLLDGKESRSKDSQDSHDPPVYRPYTHG